MITTTRYCVRATVTSIAVFVCATGALAATIDVAMVTVYGASDPLVDYLNNNFNNVGTITTGVFDDAGATGPTDPPTGWPTLTSEDIVIVTRDVGSTLYDQSANEIDFWHGLSSPVILMSAFLVENGRWGWIDEGDQDPRLGGADDSKPTAAGLTDPLLDGVTVTGGLTDLFNVGGTGGNIYEWVDYVAAKEGGGTILVNDPSDQHNCLARWDAGDAPGDLTPSFEPISNTTFGGKRIHFGMHTGGSPSDLSADGQTVLNNILAEAGLSLIPEPSSFMLAVIGLMALGFAGRSRKK